MKSSEALRVGINEPVGGRGGLDYYDLALARSLADLGVAVTLYTSDSTQLPTDVPFEVRRPYERIYGPSPAWRRGLRYLFGMFRAYRHMRWTHVRVCHLHLFNVGVLEWLQVVVSRLFGIRVVITAHDVTAFVQGLSRHRLERWVYRHADHVIAHNMMSHHELRQRFGVPNDRIAVIPHGNYVSSIRSIPKEAARARLDLGAERRVVLFFGQIKKVKGLDLLIEAAACARKAVPKLYLVIAGRPWKDEFKPYQKQIDRLGLATSCRCDIRYISNDDVPYYYAAADLIALPYRRIYQSGVLLMAMSYAKAVLAADLPGMKEIIQHGQNGLLFKAEDAHDLAMQLITHLQDIAECERIGGRARDYVTEHHDWKAIGLTTADCYRRLIREGEPHQRRPPAASSSE